MLVREDISDSDAHHVPTPHHVMEEDRMIAPHAQVAQQHRQQNMYSFGGFTPQNASNTPSNLLSTGQTPHNMLGSHHGTPQNRVRSTPVMSNRLPNSTGCGMGGSGLVYGHSSAVHAQTDNNTRVHERYDPQSAGWRSILEEREYGQMPRPTGAASTSTSTNSTSNNNKNNINATTAI